MPSLTPASRSDEATSAATREGIINGFLTLIPSTGAVYAAMKTSPKFVKATNWQSRTALAIMPPFFMYALTAEKMLNHKMEEMANESDHSKQFNEWAQTQIRRKDSIREGVTDKQLVALYTKSVEESGVRIVPGDTLSVHHKTANFFQENPFTILGCVGGECFEYF